MKNTFISTRVILFVPILFVAIFLIKIAINYYDSENTRDDFIQKQAQTLNSFMVVHRNYYQNLYLNKTIPLNDKTLLGLPAFSAYDISKQFSKENHFDITVQTVSSNARNENNIADTSELKAIEYFNNNKTSKEYFQKEEEYFQYATPLFIEQKCLKCHGLKENAPKFIANKYDNAYNYKLGELRGIISIKVPTEKITNYFTFSFIKTVFFDSIIVFLAFIISFYLIKYFRGLATELNNEIVTKTTELQKNIASLKSHQLAIDESSIVSKSDINGKITYVNQNFLDISGYTKEEVIGKSHGLLRHPDNPDELFDDLWATIKSKKIWKHIMKNRGKYNDYWVDISILPILDENGNIKEFIAVRHDITKVIQQQQKLDNIANTDTLTGFGNRYKLNQDILNSDKPALAIFNIDNFSQVNDFYGHQKGDMVIKKLGLIIEEFISKGECDLYHLQGDEFVVFDKNIAQDIFISKMKELIDKVLTTPITIEGEELHLNLSTSISFEDKSIILQTADMALKIAKKENKAMVVYDDSISLNIEYENNIKWTKKIKESIKNDKFVPVFQAIVNNQTKEWEKFESLVRMQDEDEKLISPYFFLDISKKTKHYTQITKTMINKTFDIFKECKKEFSINLTIEDILDKEISHYIYDMLEEYQLGSRVVFEIVESESIENFEEVSSFIKKIKEYGCKVAIDDFGTGYSNFEYLMKIEADYIKIDGSLIKDILHDKNSQIVVSIVVDFAKKMNMKTIAEFVESEEIFNKVVELGVDYSQGYYFCEPKLALDFCKSRL